MLSSLSLAADEATPCEKLFELATSSQVVIARIVAENASISPDVVAALQLRKDPKINRALAANPATPMAILQKLGVRYTSEFVHNPIFKMEQISDPLFLTHLQARLLKKILTHESTPESILLWACEHRGDFDFARYYTVEEWLISSRRSMLVVCSELSANIRREIAQREYLPQEIVCALAADQDVGVRRMVAGRHDLPTTVVQQLSNDADPVVRKIFLPRDLSWAIVLEDKPDESVVTNSDFRDRIIATGLPWRVRDIGTNIEMLLMPPGRFMMGASPDDLEAESDEKPAHEVLISKAFYLGRTPVTQAQWQAKRGSNPSHFSWRYDSPSRPVEKVSWNMIQEFNTLTGLRLPTEAEWEYACRAGDEASRYGVLNDIAWYGDNSGGETHAVATKLPNALGLYDMLGNVMQWCQDFYDNYPTASMVNPTGPMTGDFRLQRGGSWDNVSNVCRGSQRVYDSPSSAYIKVGFRAVRQFCALVADQDLSVRRAVARRHDLSTTVEQQLSKDVDKDVRRDIARREHLPQEIVCALAADQDVDVRRMVAGRHDLSEAFVQQLSKDVDKHVRRYIAQREHLPQEIVCALAADDDVYVRWRVAMRHDLSTTVVQQLSKDVHNDVRHHIAQREHLPQEMVCALAADQDVGVRRTVARRHDLPTTVVQQLSNDADPVVRKIFLPRDLSWAIVLEEKPDESVVTNSDFRDRIIATGLPWRVRDMGTNIEMLLMPPGRFMMGASPDDLEARSDEIPAHEVLISNAFYLGRTPVTQAQWQAKRGSNPSRFCSETDSPSRPVENVSWDMIQDFNSATGFRFPTEAEWEYACRAGSSTPRYGVLNDIAWYKDNSGGETHAVATKLPNALGLYDMLGNVWEWCQDFGSLYPIASMVNPTGPITGTRRLLRGGGWTYGSYYCRASQRCNNTPGSIGSGIGFRVVRTP